jgi:hypothetical protein
MATWMPTVIGTVMCLIVPLVSFVAGIWIERHGMPVEIRWRGKKGETDTDE